MTNLRLEPMNEVHQEAAAGLLAARHARLLRLVPGQGLLPRRFSVASACSSLLGSLFSDRHTDAVVALDRDGQLVGYLAGQRQLYAPEAFASVYAEPRSVGIALHGHAVAADADATEVYTAMYAALAARWSADGLWTHTVSIPTGVPEVAEAWVELGFGRKSTCAVRSAQATPPAANPDLSVRRLGTGDDAVMARFHRQLSGFQTESPMFWPYLSETDAAVAKVRQDLMGGGDAACFVAGAEGAEQGMLLFTRPVFLSPLLTPESGIYLWEAFVDEHARGAGVGETLLAHALEWMAGQGLGWCALHYVAANPLGGPFWRRQGFRPLEQTLRRVLDDRVAWARPGGRGRRSG